MIKTWAGNEPIGDDWRSLGVIRLKDETWGVSIKPTIEGGWTTFKVYAIGRAKNKANYWGAWNGERTALAKDMGAMANHRPDLLSAVEDRLAIC